MALPFIRPRVILHGHMPNSSLIIRIAKRIGDLQIAGCVGSVAFFKLCAQLMAAAADTDECAFDIIRYDGYSIGLIYFVFGNEGRLDVITGYTTSTEDLIISAGVPATQFTEV